MKTWISKLEKQLMEQLDNLDNREIHNNLQAKMKNLKETLSKTGVTTISDVFDLLEHIDIGTKGFGMDVQHPILPTMAYKNNDNTLVYSISAPGYEEKNISVQIDNGMLKVTFKPSVNEERDHNRIIDEIGVSEKSRTFKIPPPFNNVSEKDVNCTYSRGNLHVVINRSVNQGPIKIKIN